MKSADGNSCDTRGSLVSVLRTSCPLTLTSLLLKPECSTGPRSSNCSLPLVAVPGEKTNVVGSLASTGADRLPPAVFFPAKIFADSSFTL